MITMPARDPRRRPAFTAEFGTPGDARAAMEALENHGIDGLEITVLDGHGEQGRRSADRRELVYISGRVGKGTALGAVVGEAALGVVGVIGAVAGTPAAGIVACVLLGVALGAGSCGVLGGARGVGVSRGW